MASINDQWANAAAVSIALNGNTWIGDPVDITANTTEPAEPVADPEDGTAWWRYLPADAGDCTIEVVSANPQASVAAFTGTSVGTLANVTPLIKSHQYTFAVTAGTVYWVQVAATYGPGESGTVQLLVTGPATVADSPTNAWTHNNNASGGTAGDTVTPANSGGASGDAWDTVTITGAGTLTYDSSKGAPAYKVSAPAEASLSDGGTTGWSVPALPRIAGRVELYLPSPGVVDHSPGEIMGAVWTYAQIGMGFGNAAGIVFLTPAKDWSAGPGSTIIHTPTKLSIVEQGTGTIIDTPTGTLPLDTWFRIEYDITVTNPGRYEVRLYPDRTTTSPSRIWSGTRTWANPGACTSVQYGAQLAPGPPGEFWFSGTNANGAGLPGPAPQQPGGDNPDPTPPPPADPEPPLTDDQPFPDPFDPGATAPPSTPHSGESGSATILDLIRQFSAQVKRAVRLTGPTSIEMVPANAPMPAGWSQSDAAGLYRSSQWSAAASQKVLTLRRGDLDITASGQFKSDDVRLIRTAWRLPDPLPVYALRPAPTQRIAMTFSPKHFECAVDHAFPAAPANTRRS